VQGEDSSSPNADASSTEDRQRILRIVSLALKGAGGEKVHVHLSDGSSFIAHAEIALKKGIRAGRELTPEEIEEVKKSSQIVFARQSALAFLSRSPHTRRGLVRKLRAKGFDKEAVELAVARVTELGYLDDRSYAETWARARIDSRLEGFQALYRGLVQRGVARETAGEVLSGLYPEELELEKARELAMDLPPRKAASKLTARGFRSRTIAKVLRSLGRGPEDASE
jgi:regulatory protein